MYGWSKALHESKQLDHNYFQFCPESRLFLWFELKALIKDKQ